jgi:hypothetical protein
MPRGILAAAARALIPLLPDMATDPRKLKPGELCRLLNSTPLGEVLGDRRLREQRARAGLRIGDGPTIDLFRYAAWLADEVGELAPSAPAGDEAQRYQHYRTIPQKHWIAMSCRQAKVLNEQAQRYGLPFGGAVIDLTQLARALHDFLATHARRLAHYHAAAGEGDGDDEAGADNLELYRGERYLRERLKRLEDERQLLPRAAVHDRFARCAAVLRSAGDTLQRKFGRDAHALLDQALTECERLIASLGDEQPDE